MAFIGARFCAFTDACRLYNKGEIPLLFPSRTNTLIALNVFFFFFML